MQFTITAVLAFAATAAFAAPLEGRQAGICSSGTPLCCATDVLNVADLNCYNPATTPANVDELITGCADAGQQAKCCLIPILGQALICNDVSPSAGGASTS